MQSLKCEPCGKCFTGLACFQQHEASEKHKKKVQYSASFEKPNPIQPPDSMQVHCHVCHVSISGLENYQKHCNSLEHAIMVQKKSKDLLSSSVSSTFELKTEKNQLMESSTSLTRPTSAIIPFAECKPCQKEFSGPEPYQQHLASAGHKKKCGPSIQILPNDETDSIIRKGNVDNNLPIDPQISVANHNLSEAVPSLEHDSMAQKKNEDLLSSSVSSTFELKTEQNQLMEWTITSPTKAIISFAECKPCQKEFSGPEPYQQHLASAGHKKKCGPLIQILQNDETYSIIRKENDNNLPIDAQISVANHNLSEAVPHIFAKCDVCDKQFCEALSYQIHLVSDDHKMKTGKQLLGNSSAQNQSGFKCDTCVMTFSGPVPYEQHLVSKSHRKKIITADSPKLTATESKSPPDFNLTNSRIDQEKSSINDQWFCDSCKKQCTGPIPFKTHLEGKEHSKNVRRLIVEESLRKIKVLGPLPYIGSDEIDSDLSNKVTSTSNFNAKSETTMDESYYKNKINNLNINVKSDDTKILSDKYQMNSNDLIALPNLNIIPPEQLDISVFQPDDEIVFSNPKKYRQ